MQKKYSNYTKLAFALRAEKDMLTRNEILSIPHGTRSYWRKQGIIQEDYNLKNFDLFFLLLNGHMTEHQAVMRFGYLNKV